MNNRENDEQIRRQLRSCLPDKLPTFIGRDSEIQNVVSLLIDEETAVVSLHGGPGFGKTAIAVEVSHKLDEDHDIRVIFSHVGTATSVDKMIRQLCFDADVNYEDDPRSSFIFWLNAIKDKVFFVMDDIDCLLNDKTSLFDFIRLIRKNSRKNCQIITTSRTFYKIQDLSTVIVTVDEMNKESCIALLNKICPDQDDEFLQGLAKHCGRIPLAMCIAGSLVEDFEEPEDLLRQLKERPMETLERPESDQFVNRAINISYERLDVGQQGSLVRLAVFEGNFSEDAAGALIGTKKDAKPILKNLVNRSLIKRSTHRRFYIHLLIRRFLIDQLKSEKENEERACAELWMVQYFLKLGHNLTMQSYSKGRYKDKREALKKEAHNIQNVLKICYQQQSTTTDISNCLIESEVFTTSSRSFSIFIKTIILRPIVDKFLRWCAKLAKERNKIAIKINFDCLLADQERSKSLGKPDHYSKEVRNKMETIKEEFDMHYADLKEDKPLCAHFYYLHGRCLSRESEEYRGREVNKRLERLYKARDEHDKSLELRKELSSTNVVGNLKADVVFSLLQLGKAWKLIGSSEKFRKNIPEFERSSKNAEACCEEAKKLSEDHLGQHELTSTCYKILGDQYFKTNDYNKALENYINAQQMQKELGCDASKDHVFLLNNLGKCLMESNQVDEAIQFLENARDTIEKLIDENDQPTDCETKLYTTLAFAHNFKGHSEQAMVYARKAVEFEQIGNITEVMNRHDLQMLKRISNNCENN